jgi:hypothetical protein
MHFEETESDPYASGCFATQFSELTLFASWI